MPKSCNKVATLWHDCSPVNLMYIFRTPCPKNTSRGRDDAKNLKSLFK